MRNGVGYIRVSDDLGDIQGVVEQKGIIQRYAQANDIVITDWYIDKDGIRQEFNRLVFQEAGVNETMNVIVVANSKVITRDIFEFYYYKYELERFTVGIETVVLDFGFMNSFSSALDMFIKRFNELHIANLNRVRKDDRTRKAHYGLKKTGCPMYGYDIIDHRYVVNEKEAEVVREIYYLIDKGFSYRKVASLLNGQNIPTKTGKLWTSSNVQNAVEHKMVYLGYMKNSAGMWVRDGHTAIIEEKDEDFYRHEGLVK